ncbi:MAG: type II secretion system F family protein [Bacteroidota bacterium]
MPEYRVEAVLMSGKVVRGSINAESPKEAKRKTQQLAKQEHFNSVRVRPRSNFLYKVKQAEGKPITGEQRAYTNDEVRDALKKMGYHVVYVRKKLIDLKLRPPRTDIIAFVRISADLIQQKLPFNEVLQLLVNDTQNKSLQESIREINNELKQGKDSEEVFRRQQGVFGKFAAHMLGLASKSGNMAEIYESCAKFLERQAEFKKSLKSALLMPMVTLFFLFAAVIFYVAYIFPAMAELFVRLRITLPPMTKATLAFSHFLMSNSLILAVAFIVPILVALRLLTTEKGKYIAHKYLIRIPLLGRLFHKTSVEIFCRVFYALYSGSGENIDAIKMAAEACGNKYMEAQIKNIAIPMMLKKGTDITRAFEATGVFPKTALARIHSGAETGTLKSTMLQLANYYEKDTTYRLRNAVDFISLSISMIIMIVITALTIVSSETATISPRNATTTVSAK